MLLGHTSLRAFARVVPNTWTLFPQHLPGLRPCLRRYPLAPGVATLAPLPVPALLFSAVLTTGPRGCCFLVCPSPGQLCQCCCVACVWMHLQRCSWAGGGRRKVVWGWGGEASCPPIFCTAAGLELGGRRWWSRGWGSDCPPSVPFGLEHWEGLCGHPSPVLHPT